MIEIPFDTVAAVATPNWREHAAWPQPVMASYRRGRDRIGTLLRAVSAIENDESRQIAILASCRMLVTALPLLELAYALDTQDERGMRIVGNDPLLSYLRGDGIRPEEAVNKFAPSEPNGGIVPPLLRPSPIRLPAMERPILIASPRGLSPVAASGSNSHP